MIHKGAYEWGCMGFMYAVSEIFLFSLQWASYRSVKFREEFFTALECFEECVKCAERLRWTIIINQYFAYRYWHYTFLSGFAGVRQLAWIQLKMFCAFTLILHIDFFFLNVALYYTSPFHSTPLLFLVMWFLYSAVEAVKSFIVEFNLVNTVRMGEETCLTQCC